MDDQEKAIRPNVGKAYAFTAMTILIVLVGVIGVIYYLNYLVGLDMFVDLLETFGLKVSSMQIMAGSIIIVIVVAAAAMFASYLNLANTSYVFYPDRLVIYRSRFGLNLDETAINYGNIAKINYDDKDIRSQVLGTSTVTIELSGMDMKSIDMDYIDNASQVVAYIQGMVQRFRMSQYSQYSKEKKLGQIMENF